MPTALRRQGEAARPTPPPRPQFVQGCIEADPRARLYRRRYEAHFAKNITILPTKVRKLKDHAKKKKQKAGKINRKAKKDSRKTGKQDSKKVGTQESKIVRKQESRKAGKQKSRKAGKQENKKVEK